MTIAGVQMRVRTRFRDAGSLALARLAIATLEAGGTAWDDTCNRATDTIRQLELTEVAHASRATVDAPNLGTILIGGMGFALADYARLALHATLDATVLHQHIGQRGWTARDQAVLIAPWVSVFGPIKEWQR